MPGQAGPGRMGGPMMGGGMAGPMMGGGMNMGPGGMICPASGMAPATNSQVQFARPIGMEVRYSVSGPNTFDSEPLTAPGRHDFAQGAIYRLKLTNIPGREGVELYPTLEVGPATPRIEAFLAHNAIPIQFTEEDFDQVASGNFVTKVIYLPDREFQEMALAGVEELVSTKLDPGVDPVVEADRRGAILAILRVGNKLIEMGPEMGGQPTVAPVGYNGPCPPGMPGPMAGGPGMGGMPGMGAYPMGATVPPGNVAGVTAPQYGMPITGTPIGLPGPPHIPLGIPAGLQKHVIHNHTRMNIPDPTKRIRLDVNQRPGMSYPRPVDRVRITENVLRVPPIIHRPLGNALQLVPNGGCNKGQCPTY